MSALRTLVTIARVLTLVLGPACTTTGDVVIGRDTAPRPDAGPYDGPDLEAQQDGEVMEGMEGMEGVEGASGGSG